MVYADLEDVRKRLGRPFANTAEEDLATAWLEDALRYIRRGFARRGLDLDAQVAMGDPLDTDITSFQAAVVADRVRHFDPEGLTSVTKSIDDGSVTKRREGRTLDGYDWLSPTQWDELLPLDKAQSNAFSVRPSFQPDHPHGAWHHH